MAGMNVRSDVLNQIEKPKPSGRDLAYRAVAAVFGGPVDLTAMVMKPFGYGEEKPVLGSEWIGQQMQNVGLVSEARDPMQEFMASLLVPGGGIEAALPLAAKGVAAAGGALGGLYAMHKMAGPVDKASSLARMGEATRQSGVIKGKGGNWLTGSVEDALKPLTMIPEAQRAHVAAASVNLCRLSVSLGPDGGVDVRFNAGQRIVQEVGRIIPPSDLIPGSVSL